MQPVCTRWCSEYYAVERVTSVGLDKVLECQTALGMVAKMTEADFKFLISFQAVMKHVVTAMKCLEGENHCYLGHVIPTVMGVKNKLNRISDPAMRPLVQALLAGLAARFEPLMSNQEYVLASVLLPKFKLAFLPADRRPHQKQMLIDYVKRLHAEIMSLGRAQSGTHASASSSSLTQSADNTDEEDDDLYSFLNMHNSETTEEESTLLQQVLLVQCFVYCRPTKATNYYVQQVKSGSGRYLFCFSVFWFIWCIVCVFRLMGITVSTHLYD